MNVTDNIIYGWEIDSKTPIFQVSRHKEKITDFLSLDNHNLFATCSLDKRIVLWSQVTRRVKGVLHGHKRGIKVMSYAKDTLLSAGFECEATAWDLNLHEPSFYLRGHRLPLSDVKLMVQPDQVDENLRAITVDDGGEFRLWNIFVREKGSGTQLAETLQTFNQSLLSEKTLCKIQFLVIPFNAQFSKGKYSDIIATSNKLIHFKPHKNSVDFFPPVCMAYSDPNSAMVTAVGKNLFKYDITNGTYHSTIPDVCSSEVTFFLLDGEHNRRIFVGTANGSLYLINFASGLLIGKVQAHSKELLCLCTLNKTKDNSLASDTIIYSGSTDGNIRQIKESSGVLEITHTIENAMGNHRRIIIMETIPEFKYLICIALKRWAIFGLTTMKRKFLFNEKDEITGFELLGGGGRYDKTDVTNYDQAVRIESEKVISMVLCTTAEVKIYAIDITHCRAVLTHTLGHSRRLHFAKVCKITFPKTTSVNYLSVKNQSLSLCLVAGSDEGYITIWNAKSLRLESLKLFYDTVPDFLSDLGIKAPKVKSKAKGSTLMRAASLLRKGKSGAFGLKKTVNRSESYTVTSTSSVNKKDIAGLDKLNQFTNIDEERQEPPSSTESKIHEMNDETLSQVSITSIESFSNITPESPKRQAAVFGTDRTATTVAEEECGTDDFQMSELTGNAKHAAYAPSHHCFKAHSDIIHNIEPMKEHGCIVSSSQDGYHRVWNLLGDCLGEMPLPNITDKMKKDPERYTDVWKFVVEKIPVTKAHESIAKQICHNIEDGLYDESSFVERRNAIDAGLLAVQKSKSARMIDKMTPRDESRLKILAELEYKTPSSSSEGDSTRKYDASEMLKAVSQKHLTEQESLSETNTSSVLDAARTQTTTTITTTTATNSSVFSPVKTDGSRIQKQGKKKQNSGLGSYESKFNSGEMWSPVSKILSNSSVAFSDASLASASAQGLFDEVVRPLANCQIYLSSYMF
jgi:hypothetical protein